MKSAKSYIDREELIEFLKDSLLSLNPEDIKRKVTDYEFGYRTAVLDILEEVESLI